MRFFTNKGVVQKTVIAMVIIILTTFCVPAPVQADVGGKLMSPIVTFLTSILDGIQHLLEWAMLGETDDFMKDAGSDAYNKTDASPTVKVNQELDGSFFGLDSVNVPVIRYTPEEIFSNKVPALDINFINPTVKEDNASKDTTRNIAWQIQEVIASWYVALRAVAVVGLLSVLVYLGIRMLLTSVAADRAKYKQMLMDWVVAMCLVFTLHYIMSFALTMAETTTAMISNDINSTVVVETTKNDIPKFATNLMGYVRFMIQSENLNDKLAFFALYLMLVIYSVRFTWVYLKRVVNMAFLTLIAPLVALTYPIDKVSDGKAQAFNMWIKEFSYNALIQTVHLLLYVALLGSATDLAVENPLYAIVALGFIFAAEKLVKKMFGFDKASGGTLGSLAGAAGVTAMAGKAMGALASGKGGKAGNGKVRTKDIPEREGRDKEANSGFAAFNGKTADQVIGAGEDGESIINPDSGVLAPPGNTQAEEEELARLKDELDNGDYNDAYMNPEEYQAKLDRINELEGLGSGDEDVTPEIDESDLYKSDILGDGEEESFASRFKDRAKRTAIGAWKAAPAALYKGARGTLKTASRLAAAGAMGGLGLAIGATTGDGEKALSMAATAAGVGLATGDNLFEALPGKVMKEGRSVRDAYDAGRYGNVIDARNARADKEYFQSDKFNNFHEKYFNDMSKKDFQKIVQSYRSAGITSEKDIKKALKLEEKYAKANPNMSEKYIRAQVQNIAQTYSDIDIDKKAYTDEKVEAKEVERIAGMLTGGATASNKNTAQKIFNGYKDWRSIV